MPLQLKRVLISDDIDQKCIDILESNGVTVVKKTKLPQDALIAELKQDYDGLIVRSATQVTAKVIESCPSLAIIGRAGTGVDNIDCDAATKQGVIVMNTPGGNTTSAAELTCGMILALARHIAQGHQSMQQGRWDRKNFQGNEVFGKTLAIIGLGRIGKEVSLRMQSFGMRTIGFDPIIPASESAKFNTQWLPLEEVWSQADYITVHTPLIPQTRNLINLEVLSRCKPGVRLINVARGGIIDEDSIIPAIEKGYCSGAALDVFSEEPPKNTALTKHPKIICTPHLGASTDEAQTRVAEEIAQQFIDLRDGKSLFGAINAQALAEALNPDAVHWEECGKALGKVVASLAGGKVDADTEVKVATFGEALKSSSYMTAAVQGGLLSTQSKVRLNLVNAPALAKSLGLKVESGHHHSDVSYVKVDVHVGKSHLAVSGFAGGRNVYLCSLNGVKFSQPFALRGDVFLARGKASKIIGALATENLLSLARTHSGTGDHADWFAFATADNGNKLQSIADELHHITL